MPQFLQRGIARSNPRVYWSKAPF
ncbi:hypothetical protein EMIT0215P_10136 [Pseudomonas serboccidentalis]